MEEKKTEETKQEEKKQEYIKLEGKELIRKTLVKTLFLVRAIEEVTFSYNRNIRITRLIGMIKSSLKELEKLK